MNFGIKIPPRPLFKRYKGGSIDFNGGTDPGAMPPKHDMQSIFYDTATLMPMSEQPWAVAVVLSHMSVNRRQRGVKNMSRPPGFAARVKEPLAVSRSQNQLHQITTHLTGKTVSLCVYFSYSYFNLPLMFCTYLFCALPNSPNGSPALPPSPVKMYR